MRITCFDHDGEPRRQNTAHERTDGSGSFRSRHDGGDTLEVIVGRTGLMQFELNADRSRRLQVDPGPL